MTSHDSSTVPSSSPITEERPVTTGMTDPPRLPASVKTWAQRAPAHQDVLVNVHTICDQIVLAHNTMMMAHAKLNATEVADFIASELADACAVKGSKIAVAFKTVARATFCDPGRMVRMARAQNYEEFCQAIPAHLRQACGCSVVKYAPMPKIEENRKIVLDPWKVSAERIANALGNVHTLGVAIRVS